MIGTVELIRDLEISKNPSPTLDRQIAETIGWRRVVRQDADANGRPISRGVWYGPDSDKPGTIPRYTSDLDAAQSLISAVSPDSTGGCSWESGTASARVDDGPIIPASTPALALCAVAMRLVYYQNLKPEQSKP